MSISISAPRLRRGRSTIRSRRRSTARRRSTVRPIRARARCATSTPRPIPVGSAFPSSATRCRASRRCGASRAARASRRLPLACPRRDRRRRPRCADAGPGSLDAVPPGAARQRARDRLVEDPAHQAGTSRPSSARRRSRPETTAAASETARVPDGPEPARVPAARRERASARRTCRSVRRSSSAISSRAARG